MQCQNCGLVNVPNAHYCKGCGKPLLAAPAQPPAFPPSPPPTFQPGNVPSYPQSPPPVYPPSSAPAPQPGNPPSYPQGPAPANVGPYTPPATPDPQLQQANWGSPSNWNASAVQPGAVVGSTRRVSKVSAVSVLKVVTAIYALIYAVFGCLFFVLPGILGAGLLDSLAYDMGIGGLGGASILVVLLIYVVSVFVAGLLAGLMAAISALLYNLVVRYIGGIEVEVV